MEPLRTVFEPPPVPDFTKPSLLVVAGGISGFFFVVYLFTLCFLAALEDLTLPGV